MALKAVPDADDSLRVFDILCKGVLSYEEYRRLVGRSINPKLNWGMKNPFALFFTIYFMV